MNSRDSNTIVTLTGSSSKWKFKMLKCHITNGCSYMPVTPEYLMPGIRRIHSSSQLCSTAQARYSHDCFRKIAMLCVIVVSYSSDCELVVRVMYLLVGRGHGHVIYERRLSRDFCSLTPSIAAKMPCWMVNRWKLKSLVSLYIELQANVKVRFDAFWMALYVRYML